ncbi:glutaredoxin [Pseudomonas luteola]|uniref:glutaredoxin family protein n=1 Tax=Pseudomonas TaxID=286 RepID=UPI000F77AF91|nr:MULTISPECIES: glutaredoxin [Pseudomonas]RRW39728.1 glutaredoxin [Pseudomonas luteola]
MLIKALRIGLGQTIVGLDLLTRPRKLKRSAEAQKQVEEQTAGLALYQFQACPFCVKTRRAMHKLNLPIALRDVKKDPEHREALLAGGGRIKVPCLRIEEDGRTAWMYESNDIIAYLNKRFAPASR